jgi:hypothetical protein
MKKRGATMTRLNSPGLTLVGVAAIIVGLSGGYFLLKKSHPLPTTRPGKSK